MAYIEREALLAIVGKMPLDWEYGKAVSDIYDIIKDATAADVAPVVHGEWEIVDHYPYPETIRCSSCGREFGGNTDWLRCPLCETRMDGE